MKIEEYFKLNTNKKQILLLNYYIVNNFKKII